MTSLPRFSVAFLLTALFAVAITTATATAQNKVSGEPGFGRQFIRNHPFSLRAGVYGSVVNDYSGPNASFNDLGLNTVLVWEREIPTGLQYAVDNDLDWIVLPDDFPNDDRNPSTINSYFNNYNGGLGVMVSDEPSQKEFDRVGNESDAWRQVTPHKLFYSTAFPGYATQGQLYGGQPPAGGYSYHQYLQDFVQRTKTDVLSYDYYPFRTNGPRKSSYFSNLMAVRDAARDADLPYTAFTQDYAGGSLRVPSESDLRFQAFTHLTAGYKGLTYFFYNSLFDNGNGGLVRLDNADQPVPTDIYNRAKGMSSEILNLGRSLRFLNSTAVRFVPGQGVSANTGSHSTPSGLTNFTPGDGGDPHISSIKVLDRGDNKDGLVGFFTDDDGQHYFMLTNTYQGGDLTADEAALTFEITFDSQTDRILRLSRKTGAQQSFDLINHTLTLTLPGGTGDLFKYDTGDFVVPEPTTAALFGLGGALAMLRRRRPHRRLTQHQDG